MATAAELSVEVRVGARVGAIVHAFEVLRGALDAHGHAWTAEEEDALRAAADVLETEVDAGSGASS